MRHSKEALLRPPLEFYPGLCAILIASLALANPSYFLLSPFMATSFATLLFTFGGLRTFQAYRVIRYRIILNQIRDCRIKANKLPKSRERLFLGKGFLWSTKHTQRLRDLKIYRQSIDLQSWFHSLLDILYRIIHWISRPIGNRLVRGADGNPAIHGVGVYGGEHDVCLDLTQRGNHTLVFGKAGVGKTRLAETLITQDIHRGDFVVVLDSKNDKKMRERVCLEAGKAGRVCQIFDMVPSDVSRIGLDWRSAINTKQVVYLGLTAVCTSQHANTISTSIFSDLASLTEDLYSRGIPPAKNRKDISITVHVDEASGLIDAQFLSFLNGVGQTRLRVVVYVQTLSDLVVKLNPKWELSQIMSHFPNLVMFQVSDVATTKLLTEQMPQVEVNSLVLVFGSSDDSNPETSVDFKSSTQVRKVTRDVPLISTTDITQLPKGQCFCLVNGSQLYKLRTFLLLLERGDDVAHHCFAQQTQFRGYL